MALSANTIWQTQTDGSDTLNGGAFDPSVTAGMFTDGAATSANTSSPVFTSASYNFVAGDVGAWIYIASGTNWTPGWYKIASVAANAATLTGTIGLAVLAAGVVTTVVGCATTASPTGAVWSIDYSQQAAAQFTYTDLASVGAGLTISSAAKPFGKEQVGNSLIITGGTNFTTGVWVIASVAAGVATLVGPANVTTGAGLNGTGGQGGAKLSPAIANSLLTGGRIWCKSGTYPMSASTNVAAGSISASVTGVILRGYGTTRGDGTKATFQASANSVTLINLGGSSAWQIMDISFDANSKTTSRGIGTTASTSLIYKCKFSGFTSSAINTGGASTLIVNNEITGCSVTSCISSRGDISYNYIHDNAASAIALGGGTAAHNLITNNTSAHGISLNGIGSARCNTIYNCDGDGILMNSTGTVENNLLYGCGAFGIDDPGGSNSLFLNNAAGSNTSGNYATAIGADRLINNVALTADPFTNKAGGDYSLNNVAGGGAACRVAGVPGAFPGLATTTGYTDIGTVQHQDTPPVILSRRQPMVQYRNVYVRPRRFSVSNLQTSLVVARRMVRSFDRYIHVPTRRTSAMAGQSSPIIITVRRVVR